MENLIILELLKSQCSSLLIHGIHSFSPPDLGESPETGKKTWQEADATFERNLRVGGRQAG